MTRFLLFLFCVAMIAACKPGIPKDIVQPAEMEKILYDIHVLDGYVATIPIPDSAKKISAPLYKGIFKKYGIDSAEHAKSMTYYYKHPDILSKMYNRISERLTKAKEVEIKREEKEAKLKAKKVKPLDEAVEAKSTDTIKPKTDTAKRKVLKPVDSAKKAKLVKPVKRFKKALPSVQ